MQVIPSWRSSNDESVLNSDIFSSVETLESSLLDLCSFYTKKSRSCSAREEVLQIVCDTSFWQS